MHTLDTKPNTWWISCNMQHLLQLRRADRISGHWCDEQRHFVMMSICMNVCHLQVMLMSCCVVANARLRLVTPGQRFANLPFSFAESMFQPYVRCPAFFGLEIATSALLFRRFQARLNRSVWPQGNFAVVVPSCRSVALRTMPVCSSHCEENFRLQVRE